MSHTVRTYTRTVNGRTVRVSTHSRDDDGGTISSPEEEQAQRKRHQFEARVLRERQQAEAIYPARSRRTPGERRKRQRGPSPAKAKRHAKKALRLWRRHKVQAVFHAGAAAGHLGSWAAWKGGKAAWRGGRRAGRAAKRAWQAWQARRVST